MIYFKLLYPNSKIIAFEPDDTAFSCLEYNIAANSLNSIVPHKTALSNREGSVDLYYDSDNPGGLCTSTKRERMANHKRVVPASLLSKHIDNCVDFLKMDVEGAELEILTELKDQSKLTFVKQMIIEYHHHIVKDADEFSRILAILEDTGFGYQIHNTVKWPMQREQYQDILIYAYSKRD